MEKTVERAVARKRFWYINEHGKRDKAEVGQVIKVTAAQALAFPENLVAPEVLKANAAAAAAIKEATAEADKAKQAALSGNDDLIKEVESDQAEETKHVKKGLG
jgi:hypothetical protein